MNQIMYKMMKVMPRMMKTAEYSDEISGIVQEKGGVTNFVFLRGVTNFHCSRKRRGKNNIDMTSYAVAYFVQNRERHSNAKINFGHFPPKSQAYKIFATDLYIW